MYTIHTHAGNHGSYWWHIAKDGATIMSGFEATEEEAKEKAKSILRGQGVAFSML